MLRFPPRRILAGIDMSETSLRSFRAALQDFRARDPRAPQARHDAHFNMIQAGLIFRFSEKFL